MRKDIKRKVNKVANYSLAFSLVGAGVGLNSLVTPTHTVLAAKNHDGGMSGGNKEWGVSVSG